MFKKYFFLCIGFFFINMNIFSDTFSFVPDEKLKITEKYNLSKKINGKYIGHVYKENRSVLKIDEYLENKTKISGVCYSIEEIKSENRILARAINNISDVKFELVKNGQYKINKENPYPNLRSFPIFPDKDLKVGEKWQAYGERIVDPVNKGIFTKVPILCEYTYLGESQYNGEKIQVVKAKYAMRYKQGQDKTGDFDLQEISGTHDVTINIFDPESGKMIISDIIREEYRYNNQLVSFTGSILTWVDVILKMNKVAVQEQVNKVLKEKGIKDVKVEKRKEGVSLTMNKLHFLPDQAVILPNEKNRLDTLADTLKSIEKRTIMIVGHTANVGSMESQEILSLERAKAVSNEMVKRGISASRIIYEGRGGREGIAPNDTEENRARNRRVEIIILED